VTAARAIAKASREEETMDSTTSTFSTSSSSG
jgi:hypothetical protein